MSEDTQPGTGRAARDRDVFVKRLGLGTNVLHVPDKGRWLPSVRLDIQAVDGRELTIYLPSDAVYQMLDQLPELLVQASEDARRRMADG